MMNRQDAKTAKKGKNENKCKGARERPHNCWNMHAERTCDCGFLFCSGFCLAALASWRLM